MMTTLLLFLIAFTAGAPLTGDDVLEACRRMLFNSIHITTVHATDDAGHWLPEERPDLVAAAAHTVEQLGADILDINCGCPSPKVTGGGHGASLLRDLPLRDAAGRPFRVAAVDLRGCDIYTVRDGRVSWAANVQQPSADSTNDSATPRIVR